MHAGGTCSKAYLIFDTSFSREKREVYEKEEEEEV